MNIFDETPSRIEEAIILLRRNLEALEGSKDVTPVAPSLGGVYLTYNDSLVIITELKYDGAGKALVVKGGHGTPARGEEAGEFYFVDEEGYYSIKQNVQELTMSLRQKLPADLSAFLTEAEPTDPEERILRSLSDEKA